MLAPTSEKDCSDDCPPYWRLAMVGRFGMPPGEQSSKSIVSTAESPAVIMLRSSETSNFGSAQAVPAARTKRKRKSGPWKTRPHRHGQSPGWDWRWKAFLAKKLTI